LPFYAVYKALHEHFSEGTPLFAVTSSSPNVEALASDEHVLLINKRAAPVTVTVGGQRLELQKYEVRLLALN